MALMNLFSGPQWRNRHREQTYGHGVGEGEGEMYGKSNIETYNTICIIGSTFIHIIRTDSNCVPFYGSVVFHCIYVHIYTASLSIHLSVDI